jgi:hypothetical protein
MSVESLKLKSKENKVEKKKENPNQKRIPKNCGTNTKWIT